jgi:transposase-like protein
MPVGDIFSKFLENGGGDIVRDIVERGMQALIELEAEARVGAAKYERSGDRNNLRNGSRERELDTRVGTVHLKVPKFRKGSFFPSVLQARRRSEQALMSVIQEAYVHGVSTRNVDEIAQALGLDGVSKSEVSRICKSLETQVNDFRDRPLDSVYVYVWLDATYIKVREGGRICNKALLLATGLNADGEREVIGFKMGAAESHESWLEFLRGLVARGMGSPLLVISDAHEGLKKAIQTVFAGSAWQRCKVHFMRNVLSQVGKNQQPVVSAALKQIFMQTDLASAEATVNLMASRLEPQLSKVAAKLRNECTEALNFMAFPHEHWRQINSTNGLERLNRELKRRANVVGIFPNDDAVLRLLGSILIEQNDEWAVSRNLISQESIKKALALRPDSQPAKEDTTAQTPALRKAS